MLTESMFNSLKRFLAMLPADKPMYGHAVIYEDRGGEGLKPVATVHINNYNEQDETLKPVNYFISGDNIEGVHYSRIGHIHIVCGQDHFTLNE